MATPTSPADDESPPGPRRRASSAATRAKLIDAATALFVEHGPNLRLQEVARRAGLTTGAIYSNFPDKLGLLGEVLRRVGEREMEAISAQRGEGRHRPAAQLIAGRIGPRLVRAPKEGAFLLIEAMVGSRRDDELKQSMQAAVARRHDDLTRLVERGMSEGDIDPDVSARAVARLVQAVTLGSAVLAATEAPAPSETEWRALVARLLAALEPPAS
jgi:AcrR family transcriptional regulator